MIDYLFSTSSNVAAAAADAEEFPAYAAKTAPLIPFLRNETAGKVLAWAGLCVSLFLQMNCGAACGLT
jgi:hypothetical protein